MATQREKAQALEALRAYRKRRNEAGKLDSVAPVAGELWDAAEVEPAERLTEGSHDPLSWTALAKRIRDLGKDHGRHEASTTRVVRYLLEWAAELPQKTAVLAPRTKGLVINCPNTIFDYRAVIVGQLPDFDPRAALYPAVFVKPNDDTGYWYPQCSYHNPLVVDRAFACLAHFGNPSAIGHRRPRLPLRFEVRVYALTKKWTKSRRLSPTELEDIVTPLREPELSAHDLDFVEKSGEDDVTRNATGIDGIRIADRRGNVVLEEGRPIDCACPVTIGWEGTGGARLEIRHGQDDRKVWEDAVASGVTLNVKGTARPAAAELMAELEAGLYRIKLYPQKPSFLGPECEWWLNLT